MHLASIMEDMKAERAAGPCCCLSGEQVGSWFMRVSEGSCRGACADLINMTQDRNPHHSQMTDTRQLCLGRLTRMPRDEGGEGPGRRRLLGNCKSKGECMCFQQDYDKVAGLHLEQWPSKLQMDKNATKAQSMLAQLIDKCISSIWVILLSKPPKSGST